MTLQRDHQATTVGSSSLEAKALDEAQYGYGMGPCLHAIRTGTTTVVHDGSTDARWHGCFTTIKNHGYSLVLGVPLALGADGGVVVNLYAREPQVFMPRIVNDSSPTPLKQH